MRKEAGPKIASNPCNLPLAMLLENTTCTLILCASKLNTAFFNLTPQNFSPGVIDSWFLKSIEIPAHVVPFSLKVKLN